MCLTWRTIAPHPSDLLVPLRSVSTLSPLQDLPVLVRGTPWSGPHGCFPRVAISIRPGGFPFPPLRLGFVVRIHPNVVLPTCGWSWWGGANVVSRDTHTHDHHHAGGHNAPFVPSHPHEPRSPGSWKHAIQGRCKCCRRRGRNSRRESEEIHPTHEDPPGGGRCHHLGRGENVARTVRIRR